jgi:hypothetical protein
MLQGDPREHQRDLEVDAGCWEIHKNEITHLIHIDTHVHHICSLWNVSDPRECTGNAQGMHRECKRDSQDPLDRRGPPVRTPYH